MRKRAEERLATAHYLTVKNLVTDEPIGYLGNISANGLMLYLREPSRSRNGRLLPLMMVIPQDAGEARIFLPARQVWCSESSFPGLYAAGFQLDGLSRQGRREVRSVMQTYGCTEHRAE